MAFLRSAVIVAASCLFAGAISAQQVDLSSGSVVQIVGNLRPGQFVWAPQIAPDGPMLMVVNLRSQRAVLYRNGVPIAATTVSTGKPGHDTPTGIFTILQKHVVHHSSKYDNAPMPYMQRLTWQGVALHAGNLPGYPASHGCIRLPAEFAKLLYGATALGMTVVIADVASAPHAAPAPDILAGAAPDRPEGTFLWTPERADRGPVSVIVSAADREALVLRNGTLIGKAPVSVSGTVTGTWAYMLRTIDKDGQHWVRVPLSGASPAGDEVQRSEWQRFTAPDAFKKNVAGIVAPGTTIVVTPDSLSSAAAPATVLESGS